jgi:hypothetical protein
MPRDVNGLYQLPVGNPVVTGTVISADWANGTMPDLGGALTDSLSRSGAGGMTAALQLTAGSAIAPAIYFASTSDTGFFYDGLTPLLGVAFNSTKVAQFDGGGFRAARLGVTAEYDLPTADGAAENFLMTDGAGNVTFTDRGMLSLDTETITLSAGQTDVTFTLGGTLAYYHIVGISADNGLIHETTDYIVVDDLNITLLSSYPAGTQIVKFLYHTPSLDTANDAARADAAAAAAATSEANAATSAANLSTAETNASNSASSAATSASNAATSETNASNSASSAATSASNASNSASAASTSASNANTSATNAATSESNAAASASLAADWAESPTEPGGLGSKSAKTWAGEAETTVNSINLPTISAGDATKLLEVNGTEDGYTLRAQGSGGGLDADTLDSLNSVQFLRSDVADIKTAGNLTFNDSIMARFGTGADTEMFHDGNHQYMDLTAGNYYIRDGATTRFTFARTTGDFTATGNVTAYSDIKLKTNLQVIPSALDKVQQLNGYTYDRTDIDKKDTGLVAQEVLKVLPEAVGVTEDGTMTLAYGNMIGLLVEAIKELNAEVEELKNGVTK